MSVYRTPDERFDGLPGFPFRPHYVDQDGLRMHYFDTRGVHRIYDVRVTDEGWETAMNRDAPTTSFASADERFSQRMSFTFEDDDRTMRGKGKLSHDGHPRGRPKARPAVRKGGTDVHTSNRRGGSKRPRRAGLVHADEQR